MNIREFWIEKKEQKKQLKKQTKEERKKNRSPEQKLTRSLCIIFTVLVVFGVIFTTCENFKKSPNNDADNDDFSQEIVELLTLPVDTNLLLIEGRYSENDWKLCVDEFEKNNEILTLEMINNIDLQYKIENSVSLDSVMLRGLIYNIFGSESSFTIKDFKIYKIEDLYYEKSIVYLPLEDNDEIDIEGIYLTTISEIDILDNNIVAFNSNVTINNLDNENNEKVVDELNDYYDYYNKFGLINLTSIDLNIIVNNIINSSINMFVFDVLNAKSLEILENGLKIVAE